MGLQPRRLQRFTEEELELLLGKQTLATQKTHQLRLVQPGHRNAQLLTEEKLKTTLGIQYLSLPLFPSIEMLLTAIKSRPWAQRFQLPGQGPSAEEIHYQQQIWRGHVAAITVDWIDDWIGYGAFANQHLEKGEFVATYTGVVRQVARRWPDTNGYCMYYPTRVLTRHVIVVDSLKFGNESRFINHSDHPNLDLDYTCDRGLLFFYVRANRPIGKGTQLTFNYGADYWRERKKKTL